MKLYSWRVVDDLIRELEENHGYECCQIFDSVVASGSWICVPPDDDYPYYVIGEKVLNEWNSAQTIHRCKKLSKVNERLLVEYYAYGTR